MDGGAITSIILSVITALTAILALVFSAIQIWKSNKQRLFDRRLKAYLIVNGMVSLCDSIRSELPWLFKEAKQGPIGTIDLTFCYLTNDVFLEEIQPVIKNCLDAEWQRKFLIKLAELGNLSEEIRIIFSRRFGGRMADFVLSYKELLMTMYRYGIIMTRLNKQVEREKRPFPENNDTETAIRADVVKCLKETVGFADFVNEELVLAKARRQIHL